MKIRKNISNLISVTKTKFQDFTENILIKGTHEQFIKLRKLNKPIFIIGIPGSLHILEMATKFIPPQTDWVLIMNGMDQWEQDWSNKHLHPKATISINSNHIIKHSKILDMLFDNFSEPFGILDYDCFVFNPNCFTEIQTLAPNILLNSLFEFNNVTFPKIRIPHTFFLFFNTKIINFLRKKYHVGSDITDFQSGISNNVVNQLAEIGIDRNNYPEKGKNYFDTLRLLVSLGYSEGYKCNILDDFKTGPNPTSDAFHVGGVANPNSTYGWWAVRGSYFWRRALEEYEDQELKSKYLEKFGYKTSAEVFSNFPEYKKQTSPEFFDFVEWIVSQKQQR